MENQMQAFDLAATFGLADMPPGNEIEGGDAPTIFTPQVDPDYKFRLELIRDMYGFWFSGEIAMRLIGHPGCGKTSIVEQWHARLNLPLLTVVAHPRMEIADLLGHYVPTSTGGLAFHYGPVARAAKEGCSVLIDEYYVLDPGVATGLNGILQGGMVVIPETGEAIRPKEGFRVFAATNPADVGSGYFGRNSQDAANNDRFITLKVDYPTPEEEIPVVKQVFLNSGEDESLAQMFAERMVDVAGRVRKQFVGESDEAGAIDVTLSTRALKRWANLMTIFSKVKSKDPVLYALERAVTNGTSKETAKAMHDIVEVVFGVGGAG
jgi:cobaltochelatase CobS